MADPFGLQAESDPCEPFIDDPEQYAECEEGAKPLKELGERMDPRALVFCTANATLTLLSGMADVALFTGALSGPAALVSLGSRSALRTIGREMLTPGITQAGIRSLTQSGELLAFGTRGIVEPRLAIAGGLVGASESGSLTGGVLSGLASLTPGLGTGVGIYQTVSSCSQVIR